MRGNHKYTPEQLQFIKDKIPGRSYADMTNLFNRRFNLSVTFSQMKNILIWYKLGNGRDTRFRPESDIRKGSPVGAEHKNTKGYVIVRTSGTPRKWKPKHVLIWEAAHGPVPKGHIIIFADKNKSNFDLDNLLLVSKKEHGVMNSHGLNSIDPELTKTGKMIAGLAIAISACKRKIKKSQT